MIILDSILTWEPLVTSSQAKDSVACLESHFSSLTSTKKRELKVAIRQPLFCLSLSYPARLIIKRTMKMMLRRLGSSHTNQNPISQRLSSKKVLQMLKSKEINLEIKARILMVLHQSNLKLRQVFKLKMKGFNQRKESQTPNLLKEIKNLSLKHKKSPLKTEIKLKSK